MQHNKRLFFAFETEAPWPDHLPEGRILQEKDRHLTLVFLGNSNFPRLQEYLSAFPDPFFKLGFVGTFDQCLFFPKKHARVAAWHMEILDREADFFNFQKSLSEWLNQIGFKNDTSREFTPHVTISRSPFSPAKWKNAFERLPFTLSNLHLYESVGNLEYRSLWMHSFAAPFEPLEHTADLAFIVRGENFTQLFLHAKTALAFSFPKLLNISRPKKTFLSLEEVIHELNSLIFEADKEIGCPFKAVSLHTNIVSTKDIFEWEMIIDV